MAVASESAYAAIREALGSGRFQAGQRLYEEELTALTGVSRTPVREALRRLDAEGFVYSIANRGVYVASWSASELDALLSLRLRVEGFAARLAAERMASDQLAELSELNREMRKAARGLATASDRDRLIDEVTRMNNEFHERVIRACGERLVESLATRLVKLSLVRRAFENYSREDLHRSFHHHDELLAAVAARDPNWAESVTRSHLFAARAVLRGPSESITSLASDPHAMLDDR